MQITFFGPDSYFGSNAFYDDTGEVDLEVQGASTSTEIVLIRPGTDISTTLSGTGFVLSGSGSPSAGTINSVTFQQGNTTVATFTGLTWSLVAFDEALSADDSSGSAALFAQDGPITIDTANATTGFDMLDFVEILEDLTVPVTVIGSDFEDVLVGGGGNDAINPGSNPGYDRLVASAGNDSYDFSAADAVSYYDIFYGRLDGPVTVSIDTATGSGGVTGAEGTDVFTGLQNALPVFDGMGVYGTPGDDTFNLDHDGYTGFVQVSGVGGNDVYNITFGPNGGFQRINLYESPTQGAVVDLGAGTIANDGTGSSDTLNITGIGTIEIQSTGFGDNLTGGASDDSFRMRGGDNVVDGGDGFDRIRYDNSGHEQIVVDLAAGTATGTHRDDPFSDTFSNIEHVRGSNNADTLLGSAADERLEGRGGNDSLNARDGDDRIEGGDGDDTLMGGAGNDTILDGSGADLVEGGAGDDVFINQGGSGDTFSGGAGSDTLVTDVTGSEAEDVVRFDAVAGVHGRLNSNLGQDVIAGVENFEVIGDWDVLATGDDADNQLVSDNGNDTLIGGNGRDRLFSGAGDDLLDASGGTAESQGFGDYVRPGLGNDTVLGHEALYDEGGGLALSYGPESVGVTVTVGVDGSGTVTGAGINDTFTFVNYFEGSQGNDLFNGSDENHFEGFAPLGGDDTINGGDGFDQLTYSFELDWFNGQGSGIVVDFAAGTATDTQGGTDTFAGINELRGSQADDDISAAGHDAGVSLIGEDGNDTLTGGNGDDSIEGGDGLDTAVIALALADVTVTEGADGWITLTSSLGEDDYNGIDFFAFTDGTISTSALLGGGSPTPGDTITGTDGADTLQGTDGDDAVSGGGGDDNLSGGDGDDEIAASAGDDVVDGGNGNDVIGGGTGNDTIQGGAGNDIIGAGQNDDQADGGLGNDVVNGGPGNDTIIGGEGDDTMGASFGNDSVVGLGGDDSLGGGTGRDTLEGGTGSDAIGGGEGDDQVLGGDGDDFVAGGGRNDYVDGGAGDDRINGGDGDDTMAGGAGADTFIYNFFKDGDADVILDFEDGIDTFRMVGVENAPGTGLAGKLAALDITDTADGALIDYLGHTILIQGVAAADLGLDDFTFL